MARAFEFGQFKDLAIGDTFDFISPNRILNSYYHRCRKVSPSKYVSVEGNDAGMEMRIGRKTCLVYHIETQV